MERWVAISSELKDHPKTREFAKALGCKNNKVVVLGILQLLWQWGQTNADENGYLLSSDEDDLEEPFVGYTSILPSLIVTSLFATGWLEREDGRVRFHGWAWQEQYYSYVKKKEKDAERKREERAKKKAEGNGSCNEGSGEENQSSPPTSSQYTEDFVKFWDAYPRKTEKQKAFKVYNTRRKEGYTSEQILEAATRYAAECKKKHVEKEYIKHPATFLGPNLPFEEYLTHILKSSEEKTYENPFDKFLEDDD